MDVHVDEVVSTVRAVDGETLVAPGVLRQIVDAVVRALREDEARRARDRSDRRLSAGFDDAGDDA